MAALALAGAGLVGAYALLWDGPAAFVSALDHGDRLFGDLHDVYLPMARAVRVEPVRPVANFFYSAFFALLLAPLGLLPGAVTVWVWGAVQALALLVLWAVPGRAFLKGEATAVAACGVLLLASQPVLHNLAWGQVSVLMAAGMLASAAALRSGRSVTAGLLLAGVTAIKYYPALLAVIFLARRDRRALAAFGAGVVALWALVPAAVLGPGDWMTFQDRAQGAILRAGWVQGDINSQYVAHVGLRWLEMLGMASGSDRWIISSLALAGAGAGVAGLLLAWRLQSRTRDTALAATSVLLSLPFLLRTSWPHYFVYLPICQVLLLQRLRGWRVPPGRQRLLAVPILLSMALASMPALLVFGHWTAYSRAGSLFVADALLLLPLAALALRREVRATGPDR